MGFNLGYGWPYRGILVYRRGRGSTIPCQWISFLFLNESSRYGFLLSGSEPSFCLLPTLSPNYVRVRPTASVPAAVRSEVPSA